MRYLFILLLFLHATLNAQEIKLRPYMDWFIGGGAILPVTQTHDELMYGVGWKQVSRKTNNALLGELGSEVLFRTRPTQVCFSAGARGGYSNLNAKDSAGNAMPGEAGHGALTAGFYFIQHADEPQAFRVGAIAGGGLRGNEAGFFGLGEFYFFEASAVKYFNRTIGASISVAKYYNMNTVYKTGKRNTYGSAEYLGLPFNPWVVSIGIIISAKRLKPI